MDTHSEQEQEQPQGMSRWERRAAGKKVKAPVKIPSQGRRVVVQPRQFAARRSG